MIGPAFPVEQGNADRDRHRPFFWLTWGRRDDLAQNQIDATGSGVMRQKSAHAGGACLFIPKPELSEVDVAAILHGADEILTGCGLPVMPVEIQVRAGTKAFRSKHQRHHPDQLGALVIDGRSVEVTDFHVRFRPHWVRERA